MKTRNILTEYGARGTGCSRIAASGTIVDGFFPQGEVTFQGCGETALGEAEEVRLTTL